MSGVILKGNTSGQIELSPPAVAGSNTINVPAKSGTLSLGLGGIQIFNTAQTNSTFTIPSGITVMKVTVIGAGGGSTAGGNQGNGGAGAGATAIKYLTGLTGGNTLQFTVGAGGTTSGTSGGGSSVSSGTQSITTITATGGAGCISQIGGNGGTATAGDINISGGRGSNGILIDVNFGPCQIANFYVLGTGGSSAYGAGNQNAAGAFPGGAGSGTVAGATGAVIFEW